MERNSEKNEVVSWHSEHELRGFIDMAVRFGIDGVYGSRTKTNPFSIFERHVSKARGNYKNFDNQFHKRLRNSTNIDEIGRELNSKFLTGINIYIDWYDKNKKELEKFQPKCPYTEMLDVIEMTKREIVGRFPELASKDYTISDNDFIKGKFTRKFIPSGSGCSIIIIKDNDERRFTSKQYLDLHMQNWEYSIDNLKNDTDKFEAIDNAIFSLDKLEYDITHPETLLQIQKNIKYLEKIDRNLKATSNSNAIIQEKSNFTFENNFDEVESEKVYNFFKLELVDSKMLSIEELESFLITAFQEKKPPKKRFVLKGEKTKGKIRSKFYRYYYEVAARPYGKKKRYVELLGEYFHGWKTSAIISNFSR
ncbi:MAG: hypothetical protein HRT71_13100 [Flavobacteriales bacterium]|nr:hypothetical protein [Flavobacteriales bacterium]